MTKSSLIRTWSDDVDFEIEGQFIFQVEADYSARGGVVRHIELKSVKIDVNDIQVEILPSLKLKEEAMTALLKEVESKIDAELEASGMKAMSDVLSGSAHRELDRFGA